MTRRQLAEFAWRPLVFALLSASLFLIVRAAHLLWSWRWPVAGDAIGYDQLGWATAQGQAWVNTMTGDWQYGPAGTPTAVRTPGLPLFLAAVYSVFGHAPNAARAALVVFNAFAAGLLADVARKQWGRWPAVVIVLSWTFWPVSVRALYYVDALLGESLAPPLLIGALWLLSFSRRGTTFAAGLLLGAAILTRPHLGLVPLLFATFSWRSFRLVLLLLLGCGVAVAPWVARNWSAFGAFVPLSSQSGLGVWAGWVRGGTGTWNDTPADAVLVAELARNNPSLLTAPELEKSRLYAAAAKQELRERGVAGVALHGLKKAALFIWPVEYGYGFNSALLVATLLALVGFKSWRSSLAAQFAASVWFALFSSAVITFFLGRYRFIATPMLLFLSGPALQRLELRVRSVLASRARQPAVSSS